MQQILLSKAEQNIIQAINELSKNKDIVRKADVAVFVNRTRANITQIIRKMEEKGCVIVDKDTGNLVVNYIQQEDAVSVFEFSEKKASTYIKYLSVIEEIGKSKQDVRQIDVRKVLGYTTATVSIFTHELEEQGLIAIKNNRLTIKESQ